MLSVPHRRPGRQNCLLRGSEKRCRTDRFCCSVCNPSQRNSHLATAVYAVRLVERVPASFEHKDGLQIGFGKCVEQPSEAIAPFEDVFANAKTSAGCETIGKQRDVPLWNHSSAPHSQQLVGCDVELQAPFRKVPALTRQRWIKKNIGGSQT